VRNEVTLSGTVRTHAARKKAIELAKSTKPGVAVNDKIDVKPAAWPSLRRLVLFLNLNRFLSPFC
jgi:hypothetical protein